jgi:hypothetical protein
MVYRPVGDVPEAIRTIARPLHGEPNHQGWVAHERERARRPPFRSDEGK